MTIDQAIAAGRALRQRGERDAALAHFQSLAAGHPHDLTAACELGHSLREHGRLEEAEVTYRAVLAADADHIGALSGMGHTFREWGDPARSLEYFEAAAERDPGNPFLLTNIGNALRELQRFDAAATEYRTVVAANPGHAPAWHGLGHIARRQGDLEAALGYFQSAAACEPENMAALAEVGVALCDLGRLDEAEQRFRQVCQSAPTQIAALLGLVRVAWLRGDSVGAQAALAVAAQAHPHHSAVLWAAKQLPRSAGRFDWQAEIGRSLAMLTAAGATPRARLDACVQLIENGIVAPLDRTLAGLEPRSPQARQLRLVTRALSRSGLARAVPAIDAAGVRDADTGAPLSGAIEKFVPGAKTLVLVFSGRGSRIFLSMDVLHRVLQTADASVLYLLDLERTRYSGGVVGLGEDLATTLTAIGDLRDRLGAAQLLTIGLCTGCLAAMRYGLALGAEATLCFSPISGVPADAALRPEGAARLAALHRAEPAFFQDVRDSLLLSAAAPKITIIFGEDREPDASEARAMADVPGVALAGIAGYREHDCVGYLLAHALLRPVLSGFVETGMIAPDLLDQVRARRDGHGNAPGEAGAPASVPDTSLAVRPVCRICGGREFTFGKLVRPKGSAPPQCVRCQSLERQRIVHGLYEGIRGIIAGWRAVQFAPDRSVPPGWFASFQSAPIDGANAIDITQTGFATGGFDLVIANHVLQRVGDEAAALREMLRIVGDAGLVHLCVPSPMHRWQTEDWGAAEPARGGNCRIYGADLPHRLRALVGEVWCAAAIGTDRVTQVADLVYFLSRTPDRLGQIGAAFQHRGIPVVRFW